MALDSQERDVASLTQTQPVASQLKRPLLPLPFVHARLVPIIKTGDAEAFEMREGCEEVVVGRHPSCQLVLEDRRVHGRHLRIYRTGRRRYFVEQLGANGCFINEVPLRKGDTRAVHHGDEISLCMHIQESRDQPFAAYLFRVAGHEADKATTNRENSIKDVVAAIPRPQPRAAVAGSNSVTEQWVRENWDIRDSLGKGYFSEVWMGTQVVTGARRAVKVVDKGRFTSFQAKNGSLLSLKDEAEVLMGLSHPGIVRVYEWFETAAHLYVVMELLEGGDLLDFVVSQGCLPEDEARRLFQELCDAIAFLHEKDVVHRDIKPDNILLTGTDSQMHVKLADFGLARNNVRSRDCRTFCGTPSYFAPEVISTLRDRMEGQPAGYGKPVDMWGIGVVLYIMLGGVPPFGEENGSLYEDILQGRYDFDVPAWSAVSLEAKDMVKQLMTVNSRERLTIKQALHHPWLGKAGESEAAPKRLRTAEGAPPAARLLDSTFQ